MFLMLTLLVLRFPKEGQMHIFLPCFNIQIGDYSLRLLEERPERNHYCFVFAGGTERSERSYKINK